MFKNRNIHFKKHFQTQPENNRIYNHKRQSIDIRDYKYTPINTSSNTISKYSLTDTSVNCPVLDQGSLGSCVSNASFALLYILSNGTIELSRLHLYLCSRAIDNSNLNLDTGSTMRGVMSAILKYGVCNETICPYDISKFNKLSPPRAFLEKYNINNFVYSFVNQDLTTIKNTILSGNPIMIGISVYNSINTPIVSKTGIIPMPKLRKEKQLGGHAILLLGYDDTTNLFKFQNSWGISWGVNGYGFLPYNYVLNPMLAYDLCTVTFNI